MSDYSDIKELIKLNKRRLHELKKREAISGLQTPPEITIEIDKLEKEIKNIEAKLNEKYQGNQIIELLTELDIDVLLENVQSFYEAARQEMMSTTDVDIAIKQCKQALEWLEESTDYDAPSNRARFYMLLGAIYLNSNTKNLAFAVDNFRQSGEQFRKRKSHLESLAELGLAFAQDEMGNLEAAIGNLDRAKQIAYQESTIPYRINHIALEALRQTIKEQNVKTLEKIQIKKAKAKMQIEKVEKLLPIFTISSSEHRIGDGGTTDLNLLSVKDYRSHNPQNSENVIVDLRKRQGFRRADFILEIDEEVNRINDGLGRGDWLLVESKVNPRELRGKLVAVLQRHVSETDVETCASLKIFSDAGDHYFLKALGKCKSILITHYQSGDISKISSYYKGHAEIEVMLAFDVRVTGEVIDRIPCRSAEKIKPDYIWEVPIVSEFPNDATSQIAEEDVLETIEVKKRERKKGYDYFGLKEENEKTDNAGINRYILIRQQSEVEDKDIVAMIIEIPDTQQKLTELRLYRRYEHCDNKRHLYLQAVKRSGKSLKVDPSGEHLVIIAENADVNAVKRLYDTKTRPGQKLKIYEQASVTIIGKYIETIEEKKKD